MRDKLDRSRQEQLLNSFMPFLLIVTPMLSFIIKTKTGNRPGWAEPHAIKQKCKSFKTLDNPRRIEKMCLKCVMP